MSVTYLVRTADDKNLGQRKWRHILLFTLYKDLLHIALYITWSSSLKMDELCRNKLLTECSRMTSLSRHILKHYQLDGGHQNGILEEVYQCRVLAWNVNMLLIFISTMQIFQPASLYFVTIWAKRGANSSFWL